MNERKTCDELNHCSLILTYYFHGTFMLYKIMINFYTIKGFTMNELNLN